METEQKNEEKTLTIPRSPLAVEPNHHRVFEGLDPGYAGHIVGYDSGGLLRWEPYKIGDSTEDIEDHAEKVLQARLILSGGPSPRLLTRFAKFVDTGRMEGDAKLYQDILSEKGMLFLLGDGNFPIGCGGASDLCTIMAVRPGCYIANAISEKIYNDIGTRVKSRATGRLRLTDHTLEVNDFSTGWFERLEDYSDVFRALTKSDVAPEGTPIKFKATFKRRG